MIFTGLVAAAAIVGASAQQMSSLSSSCQSAAAAVLTGPAATCLGVSGIVNIAMTPANQSLITPINNWLTSTCAQPACTNATLDNAISTISSGCSTDLNAAGVSLDGFAEEFKGWYPTGREVACLKDSSASDAFCITSTLQSIENYIGAPLSLNTISTIAPKLATNDLPKNLTCTNCIQAAYALVRPKLSESQRGTWDSYLSGQCGSSFTTGSSPQSIRQTANTASPGSGSSGALSSFEAWGSVTTFLVGVAGVVTLVL